MNWADVEWNRVHENEIGSGSVKLLANALQHPNCKLALFKWVVWSIIHTREWTDVEWNRLDGNQIGDEGAKSLANALQSPNCKLDKMLWVSIGWISLTQNKGNWQLTWNSLCENQITDEGSKSIATALQNRHCNVTWILWVYATSIEIRTWVRNWYVDMKQSLW